MTPTAGQESDIGPAEGRLADHEPGAVIADRGYDKKARVDKIEARGAEAVIPTQKNRAEQREVDPHRYRERNVVERFWAKAKPFRRVATRYEKKAENALAFVHMGVIIILSNTTTVVDTIAPARSSGGGEPCRDDRPPGRWPGGRRK